MKKSLLLAVASAFLGIATTSSAQDVEVVPKLINYQGKLADAGGGAMGAGQYTLRFKLFDAAAAGTLVWAEERQVEVVNGFFHVFLGGAGADPVAGAAVNDLGFAFGGAERFLETTIVVGPGIAAEQVLAPRQQLVSVPYSLVSQSADRSSVAALAESLIPELAKALNPPGTIIAYGGAVSDTGGVIEPVEGYLLCNGAAIDKDEAGGKYQRLFNSIESSWGDGTTGVGAVAGETEFNLPDLRGRFLRGVAHGSTQDPDRDIRITSSAGGNTGDNVGSFQNDAFQSHRHSQRVSSHDGLGIAAGPYRGLYNNGSTNGSDFVLSPKADGAFGTPRVSSETRPCNVGVNYLIKY